MKYIVFCTLVILIYISCQQQTEYQSLKTEQSEKINQLIQHYHDSGYFDGTVLIADSVGITYQGAFGFSNRENQIPLNTESQFYLASVSKQFTATSILLLLQEGNISIDEKIIKYLPELPEIFQEITFMHLLQHTSGIPDYYNFARLIDGFTNTDVLNVLLSVDSLEFEPGSKYKYSNSGYVLLSILVDRISGISFANFLKENAFEKAGLMQTVVFDEYADPVKNRAIGYGKDSSLTDYRFRTTGGGGIFSNVKDLYLWHQALSSEKILTPDIQNLAYEPTILNNDSTIYYGFGWNIDPENPWHVYHSGELEGFRTFFDRHLDNGIVIILLSNNSSGMLKEMSERLYEIVNAGGY